MKTPEAKEKEKVIRYLDEIGAWHFAPSMFGAGRNGIPDRVVCYRGKFIGIEIKAGENKPTPWQERCLREIVEAGGVAIWGTAEKIIRELHAILAR